MNKTELWIIVVLFALIPVAWYFISPALDVVEVNETSPLVEQQPLELSPEDALYTMNASTRAEFDAAVKAMKKNESKMSDNQPSSMKIIARGVFQERAHDVDGTALLIETPMGKVLRFEDFETVNGPELHIYLSTDLSNKDVIDLGKIKATKGNVNYDLPRDVDVTTYNNVLIWSKPFEVLFSYAELEDIT